MNENRYITQKTHRNMIQKIIQGTMYVPPWNGQWPKPLGAWARLTSTHPYTITYLNKKYTQDRVAIGQPSWNGQWQKPLGEWTRLTSTHLYPITNLNKKYTQDRVAMEQPPWNGQWKKNIGVKHYFEIDRDWRRTTTNHRDSTTNHYDSDSAPTILPKVHVRSF